jgi:hypothetical protein
MERMGRRFRGGTQEIFMHPRETLEARRSEEMIGVDASRSEARRHQEQTDEDNVLVWTSAQATGDMR